MTSDILLALIIIALIVMGCVAVVANELGKKKDRLAEIQKKRDEHNGQS
jgi:hypothetical protein